MAICNKCEGSGLCKSHQQAYAALGFQTNTKDRLLGAMDDYNGDYTMEGYQDYSHREGDYVDGLAPENLPCPTCPGEEPGYGQLYHDCTYMEDYPLTEKAQDIWGQKGGGDYGNPCPDCSGWSRTFPGTDAHLLGGETIHEKCKGFGCTDTKCDSGLTDCPSCEGSGGEPCWDCEDGRVDCHDCGGSRKKPCDGCDGDLACNGCGGTGFE